jgi:predicted metalloprotease with PDZ domain
MTRRRLLAVLFGVLFAAGVATPRAAAQALEPIHYTLTFPAPQTHYVEVQAVVPTGRKPEVDLMMATWTPGSYLMREYSRHVEGVKAWSGDKSRGAAGAELNVTKTAKNHWRIATGGSPAVTVSYRVYGREMSVRTNWIESGFALLNGAATYLTLNEPRAKRRHDVRVFLPPAWKITMTGLPAAPSGSGGMGSNGVAHVSHDYRAEDFDTLVDSPILAGNPAVYEFEVGGKKHYLVNEGEAGVFNGEYAVKDVQKIVQAAVTMWGSAPYEKYVFFNLLTEGSGGLEHRNSTVLMASRWATSTAQRYQNWLGLVSHEFFHAWNVKRLRPVELGPFDYDREVYTPSLWIAEGVTDYYGDLMLRRAGLTDDGELVAGVGQLIRTLQTTPGRLVQPVEDASFDAWIRHYRPDENSPNVAISYYTKGAVLGFLLDAKIRKATGGAKSLDDVMRLAMPRYGGAKGYTPKEFQQTVHEVAGTDFGTWWHDVLDTTKELDYAEALDWYGLRFRPADERQARATLGLTTKVDSGRLLVSQVRRGTPGYDAGINVDDEIVALGDFKVRPDAWAASMDRYQPGQRISVLVARRDQLMRLDATFGREPADTWRLEISPDATAGQRQHLSALSSGAANGTP